MNSLENNSLKITINGTGFAGDYTARVYGMIPHKNGVKIEISGICSGELQNAQKFAQQHQITRAYKSHLEMVHNVQPDIDNIACANYTHGQYAMEAAEAGVRIIVLEKPPIIWPGYLENRTEKTEVRKLKLPIDHQEY